MNRLERMVTSALVLLGINTVLSPLVGCGQKSPERHLPRPALITPTIDVSGAWRVINDASPDISLRHKESGDGAIIDTTGDDMGLSLVLNGRRTPMTLISPPDSRLSRLVIKSDGPDLIVRFYGPPLTEITDHPEAPVDPALTWVRLRQRPNGWRMILDGLFDLTLPANSSAEPSSSGVAIQVPFGHIDYSTEAAATSSHHDSSALRFSTIPAADEADAYPRSVVVIHKEKAQSQ